VGSHTFNASIAGFFTCKRVGRRKERVGRPPAKACDDGFQPASDLVPIAGDAGQQTIDGLGECKVLSIYVAKVTSIYHGGVYGEHREANNMGMYT
jgi:hypothetical protein